MAEINVNSNIKTIAYYLPQYHCIPENDAAWGVGFTEWTNVKKATPQFENHYQPKVPLNGNYYNLEDINVMIRQAELAKKYNVYGFCYYHYWFKGGKKLLERPIENMLNDRRVDIPFCLSWANENWSKRWDGGNEELIVEQSYGNRDEWDLHLQYLIPYFKDERYITLDGKPIFLIYKPDIIPNIQEMLKYWQSQASKYGFKGFCFMIQSPGLFYSPKYKLGCFDYQIKFPPFFSIIRDQKNLKSLKIQQQVYSFMQMIHANKLFDIIFDSFKRKRDKKKSNVKNIEQCRISYDHTWKNLLEYNHGGEFIEGAFVDWDNTARKLNGYCHIGASPEKFEMYMRQLCKAIRNNNSLPVIFINAWNEWAEGAYLEPDEKNEYKYLEALKKAIELERNGI